MSFTIYTKDGQTRNVKRAILEDVPGWQIRDKSIKTLFHVNLTGVQFDFVADFHYLVTFWKYVQHSGLQILVPERSDQVWKFELDGDEIRMQFNWSFEVFFGVYMVRQGLNWPILNHFLCKQIGVIRPPGWTFEKMATCVFSEFLENSEINEKSTKFLEILEEAAQSLIVKFKKSSLIYINEKGNRIPKCHLDLKRKWSKSNIIAPPKKKPRASTSNKTRGGSTSKVAPETEVKTDADSTTKQEPSSGPDQNS